MPSSNIGSVLRRTARTAIGAAVLRAAAAVVFLLSVGACATESYTPPPKSPPGYPKPYRVMGTWYQPIPNARGFEQQGIASWYGRKFHGRKTSSGEIYDMHALTAAHKTLPLGTYIRVTNLTNGRSVDVRVNDRGPFVRGRIVDLSLTAAKRISLVKPGTAEGKTQAYVPIDYYSGKFTIQVGAFIERANARRLVASLSQRYKNAHMVTYHDGRNTYYRVRVGHSTRLDQAVSYEQELIRAGFPEAFIVAE